MPPNQFAEVTSCTPGVLRMISPWLVGIEKIIEVDLIVTSRCAELAADTASNPSRTARSAENRNTASATLRIVSAVRRLLRRALLNTSPRNFIRSLHERPPEQAALHLHGLVRPGQRARQSYALTRVCSTSVPFSRCSRCVA